METALKIAVAAVAAALLATQLKGMGKGEIAMALTLCAGISILLVAVPQVKQVVAYISEWGEAAGIGDSLMASLLRVCAVAFLTELAAQMCRDTGEGALSQKVAFAGKALLLSAALPIFSQLVGLFTQVMQ
jgi:stage III sporulation protein AD